MNERNQMLDSTQSVVTSTGEVITRCEYHRRRSDPKYCVDCGAQIVPAPLRDRCPRCSNQYASRNYEGEKYAGMSGLIGAE